MSFRSRPSYPYGQASNQNSPRTYATVSTSTSAPDLNIGRIPTSNSLSASAPFDWRAARGERPPPYGPLNPIGAPLIGAAARKRGRASAAVNGERKERVVRKAGIWERISNYPSQLWFDITMIPQNLSLPPPNFLGRCAGGACHVLHIMVLYFGGGSFDDQEYHIDVNQGSTVDAINNAILMESESWWTWSGLLAWLLFIGCMANAAYVFTKFKPYHLHLRKDPINSPNATVIATDLNLEQREKPPFTQRAVRFTRQVVVRSFRFLIGSAPVKEDEEELDGLTRIQQLDVWTPPEMELGLFCVYSPVHTLMYSVMGWNNWITVFIIMGGLSLMLYGLVSWYEQLVKDRALLMAEVMYEYDHKFVYPRINVIKRDACVMTNEAEVVDFSPRRPTQQPKPHLTYANASTDDYDYKSNSSPQRQRQYGENQPPHPPTNHAGGITPRKSNGSGRKLLRF
ncbi:hypothetical protein FRC03_010355 [Tulasnella sp. 419]|nr:hypothetical protein FRC03_010355 [Tulasnella sp. 419]